MGRSAVRDVANNGAGPQDARQSTGVPTDSRTSGSTIADVTLTTVQTLQQPLQPIHRGQELAPLAGR
ncbi:MAG: hypothetical protein QM582_09495 [Micropruina sp.]|uniref:hypothetical protein n=1 Tax=Micropruina sp. TaxID=2737536 RepID=UPI0039E3A89A